MKERIIGEKYCLVRLLGEGGASEVYLARDLRLQKWWAVKKMKNREGGRVMLLREAELLSRLEHPALPRVVDWIEEGEEICLVMDFVEGRSLEQFLKESGPADGRAVCRWGMELCQVLGYLHSRKPPVLHHDLKPANLILQPDGSLKLIDLGAAARKAENIRWGTKGYSAPERLRGGCRTDERADIYSMGVTLYRLATGRLPENTLQKTEKREGRVENNRESEKAETAGKKGKRRGRIPGLSGRLSAVIWKCMDTVPERRFRSCCEVRQALERCRERKEAEAVCRRKLRKAGQAWGGWSERRGAGRVSYGRRLKAAALCLIGAGTVFLTGLLQENGKSPLPEREQAARAEEYLSVLEDIGEDRCFTAEEEQMLLTMWEQDGVLEWKQELYQELTFQIGRMYWRRYLCSEADGSGNQLAGRREAVPWFERASRAGAETELGKAAALYAFVGNFYRDLLLTVREEPEQGWYGAYWEKLCQEMKGPAASAKLPEEARLEFFRMCLRAAECWQDGFRQDGISDDELVQFRKEVLESAEKVKPEGGEGKELLQEIRKEAERD